MENKQIESILERYESLLSWKKSGDVEDRVEHCLSQFRQIADNSIFESKRMSQDVKSQFQALSLVIDGLTSDGLNHGQKRVIANHVITMLRAFIDKIDNAEFTFSSQSFDRFDFFRTDTPERRLHEKARNLKHSVDNYEAQMKRLEKEYPDIYLKLTQNNLPF